jgi:hypothetical protein
MLIKLATPAIKMAATGKRIHIMQGPNDWKVRGDFAEKRNVFEKPCNPMEIQNIARWDLA